MRTKLIKTITLLTALLIMLAGCAMNGSIEQSGLEGPTAEKGWTTSSRTTINNVYFQADNYYYLGLNSGGGVSGPGFTRVVISPNPQLWTVNIDDKGACTIGNLELRQGGGVSGPGFNYFVANSSSPTRWTFTEIQAGYYTISSGGLYLAASIGGGVSGPVQAAPTVSTTPYIWLVNTAN